MYLVYTIEHTGTQSLNQYLGRSGEIFHCGEDIDFTQFDEIHTTYRNPYRVAASWANRGKLDYFEWSKQWEAWHNRPESITYRINDLPVKINSHPDTYGLHKALDNGDLEHFYKHVPEKYIEAAHGY